MSQGIFKKLLSYQFDKENYLGEGFKDRKSKIFILVLQHSKTYKTWQNLQNEVSEVQINIGLIQYQNIKSFHCCPKKNL